MTLESIIASELSIPEKSVVATVTLLDDGSTIPFISRYRKEATGSLDEVMIFRISNRIEQLRELEKRKQHILDTIYAQGKLTDTLRQDIESTFDANRLEDLYMPFKPRRRTRAGIARENGLEPLAKILMAQGRSVDLNCAVRYLNDKVADMDAALAGASDIIAEWISEDARIRQRLRNRFNREARLTATVVKGKEDEAATYANYKDFGSQLKKCSSHQILAILRAAREGVMKFALEVNEEEAVEDIVRYVIHHDTGRPLREFLAVAATDSYKRLLRPSIENEVITEAKERADAVAIETFSRNLRQLLLGAPLGPKRVLAIDPGFRTGCKVVCLDESGTLLHHDVIYPTAPKNDFKGAARKISYLVEAYRIDAISLGNGTASRETERFLKSIHFPRSVDVYVVNESGASVYSASKMAREEFPDKDVTVRGAVSIGRRLIDPLAELVKIDPKSIGVGQYQHDVDQKKLKDSLDMTVAGCVNSVGVDINTASPSLLRYVSGIGPSMASGIVEYRCKNGTFRNRRDLLKVPRLGVKVFQQAAGFLRIPGGDNILDNTAVHPESYHIVEAMAKDLGIGINELVSDKRNISAIDINRYKTSTTGLPTLRDIIYELEKPGRDPRNKAEVFSFDDTIREIGDLSPGMVLPGIVNNITEFGVFVDIGIHQSGLVHMSQLADRFVSNASEIVSLNQHVRVKVLDIDVIRKRISLSMKNVEQ